MVRAGPEPDAPEPSAEQSPIKRTRTVPASIRRALARRDRGCRFPGCGQRFCDAHHIVHWADGGATKLDNLVLLCRHHHRAVHEEGFGVRFENGDVAFTTPGGRRISNAPRAPEVEAGEGAKLRLEQERLGIDAGTTITKWNGEPLDLDWAVRALKRAFPRERGP